MTVTCYTSLLHNNMDTLIHFLFCATPPSLVYAAVIAGIMTEHFAMQLVGKWEDAIVSLTQEAANALSPLAQAAFGVADPRFYVKVSLSCTSLFRSC